MTPNEIRAGILLAKAELRAAQAAQARAIAALEALLEARRQQSLNTLPEFTAPLSQHRREHKSGCASKINEDPDLRAFIMARIEYLTFQQVTDAVRSNFSQERRVGRSSIHRWWHLHGKRLNLNHL